jgi:butyrate kinase
VDPNVTYTVKEMLAKIEGKIDGVIITIGQKADKHDVEDVSARVAKLEAVVSSFEADKLTAREVARTLAAKEKEDRTLWETWRSKVAWVLGIGIAVAQVHISFPHLHF